MKKIISVSIDEELHKKAKKMRVGISAFLDIKLREYLAFLEGKGGCCEKIKDEGMAEKLIEAGLSYFDISMDGINAKTHDYIRGVNGVYEKAMSTIKYLQHYSKGMNSDLSIIVATVIMGTNMHELVDVVEWVQKEGLAGVIFNPLGPACDSDSQWHKKSELWPRKKDLKELLNL